MCGVTSARSLCAVLSRKGARPVHGKLPYDLRSSLDVTASKLAFPKNSSFASFILCIARARRRLRSRIAVPRRGGDYSSAHGKEVVDFAFSLSLLLFSFTVRLFRLR